MTISGNNGISETLNQVHRRSNKVDTADGFKCSLQSQNES